MQRRTADRTAVDRDRAFTLVELMVVVLVIGILLAVAVPTFLGARTRAQDAAAQVNLRNAATAAAALLSGGADPSTVGASALAAEQTTLRYVTGANPSTGHDVVSVSATPVGWASAVRSASGTCRTVVRRTNGTTVEGTITGATSGCTGAVALANDLVATAAIASTELQAGAGYCAATGHWYERAAAPNWTSAQPAALATTRNGLGGYLATITTAAEQACAAAVLNSHGWIGARRTGTNRYGWTEGPEAGTTFWDNGPVSGVYQNFASGQPDLSTEWYVHIWGNAAFAWNNRNDDAYPTWALYEYGG